MKKKKLKIIELFSKVHHPLLEFFDLDSDEMLDTKIKVLTDLANGKTISEIPEFYDILELYPEDGKMWDI